MKTTHIILGALVLAGAAAKAQKSETQAKVRIMKVETVNGKQTVVDTTFMTNNLKDIKIAEGNVNLSVKEVIEKGGKVQKTITVNTENTSSGPGSSKTTVTTTDDPDAKIETIVSGDGTVDIKETKDKDGRVKKVITIKEGKSDGTGTPQTIVMEGADSEAMAKSFSLEEDAGNSGKTVVIKKAHCGATPEELKNNKTEVRVFIIKNVDITDASEDDLKRVGGISGIKNSPALLNNMDFYPNPNNGKFNLRFDLKEKGNTSVTVFSMEGKTIYSETLNDFSGTYDKEIDISKNPKGVYFVKVTQGEHAQLKKIILE